jgi:MbtH protein
MTQRNGRKGGTMGARDEDVAHRVVVNHEEQYSIWPADLEIPAGWREVRGPRSKEDCLRYIGEVWTDMRPLSLRRAMDEPKPSGS